MEISNKLTKAIKEVNYLRVENAARYRVIMRYFFLEYEKIHYWLHKEDIYEMMTGIDEFQNYTMDLCQQDLQSLVEWGNLTAIQDSQKVKTVEDFKNRKYRYQLTEYSVEIERLTIRLENLEIEGASLEPTLLERIYQNLCQINEVKNKKDSEIHAWLQYLINDFITLNQNYQDYIKTLNSAKAEELMKTEAFLVYKDKLISYLRSFVKTMQETGNLIALQLESIDQNLLEKLINQAVKYELSIPRIDVELDEKNIYDNYCGKWDSFYRWFVGKEGQNEIDRLNDITNEIIRKITRYATQIVELNNRGSNRKEQYEHLAKIFLKCRDINEAHCLSAYVFGVSDCLHLKNLSPRETDNINSGVYDEKPDTLKFDSHSRIVRKKTIRKPSTDYTLEKRMQQLEIEENIAKQKEKINKLIINNQITFNNLPVIDEQTRKTLLSWLSKGLAQTNRKAKTDDGKEFYIDEQEIDEECVVKCYDGNFIMPSYKIVFLEETNEY